jgi:hypothetical protein
MQDLGPATDDQVILAWLEAEIDSLRFEQNYVFGWESAHDIALVKNMIATPNLANPMENYIRKTKLALVRGFGWGQRLFRGLTDDIAWRRVKFTIDEVGEMRYTRLQDWMALAPDTRKVSEGAAKVGAFQPPDKFAYILVLAKQIHDSDPPPSFPKIICLRRPDGGVSVMEGHGRATAYAIESAKFPDGIVAYLGDGASVAQWLYL